MIDALSPGKYELRYLALAGLVALVLLSCITIFVPVAIMFAMLALVVPGLILLAAPAVLPYYAVALGIGWITRGWTQAIAILVALSVLGFTPPLIANRQMIAQGKALTNGDHSAPLPTDRRTIAFLFQPGAADREPDDSQFGCGQYCLRLLYTGEADAVLVGTIGTGNRPLDMAMLATWFHVEQRNQCPPVTLRSADSGSPDNDDMDPRFDPAITDTVALAMANGRCLIRDMAPLNMAQVIVRQWQPALDGPINRSTGRELMWARRLDIFSVSGGKPTELVRRTEVHMRPLISPWIWTRDDFFTPQSRMDFLRRETTTNPYDLTDMLHEAGLKLDAPQAAVIASDNWPLRTRLAEGLADPKAVGGDPRLMLARQYLQAIARLGPVDGTDAALVAKISGDDRIADSERIYVKKALEKIGR